LTHSPDRVRQFFAASDGVLDYLVLRPLSHVTLNWELTWDDASQAYVRESDSFASMLNGVIADIAAAIPPARYHDSEDQLALFAIGELGWSLRKVGRKWIGVDYDSLLEQGGFEDVDQRQLILAAAGRVHAALDRDQLHFDDMEKGHRRMLGAILTIILYHRGNEFGYQLPR
jgi:hypothetical protein